MNIKKKAKTFVKYLANQISSGKVKLNKKKLLAAFNESVNNLPNGDLKEELKGKVTIYLRKLQICMEKGNVPEQRVGEENGHHQVATLPAIEAPDSLQLTELPFNLYWKKGHKINRNATKNISDNANQQICHLFLREKILTLSDRKIIKLLGINHEELGIREWIEKMRYFLSVFTGNQHPQVLHKLMKITSSGLVEYVEKLTEKGNSKLARQMKTNLISFLTYFHHQYSAIQQALGQPSYEDMMAAMLSMCVDLQVAVTQDGDDSQQQKAARQITNLVVYLLHHKLTYGLDVIAQLGSLHKNNTKLLIPLLRRILCTLTIEGAVVYTKYICTVRQTFSALGQEELQDVVKKSMSVAAPNGYLEWLRERDATILDEMPETRHFVGAQITRFLMEEADSDLIEALLNVVTEDLQVEEEEEDEPKTKRQKMADNGHSKPDISGVVGGLNQETKIEDEAPPMFFIDKSADKNLQEFAGVSEETRDESDIEIDEATLDREIEEMDQSEPESQDEESSSSEEDESEEETPKTKDILAETTKALDDVIELKDMEDDKTNDGKNSNVNPLTPPSERKRRLSLTKDKKRQTTVIEEEIIISEEEEIIISEEEEIVKSLSPLSSASATEEEIEVIKTIKSPSPKKRSQRQSESSVSETREVEVIKTTKSPSPKKRSQRQSESSVSETQDDEEKITTKSPSPKKRSQRQSESSVSETREVEVIKTTKSPSPKKRSQRQSESSVSETQEVEVIKTTKSPSPKKRSEGQSEAVVQVSDSEEDMEVEEILKSPSPLKKSLRSREIQSPVARKKVNSPRKLNSPRKFATKTLTKDIEVYDFTSDLDSPLLSLQSRRKSTQPQAAVKKIALDEEEDSSVITTKKTETDDLTEVIPSRTLRTRTVSQSSVGSKLDEVVVPDNRLEKEVCTPQRQLRTRSNSQSSEISIDLDQSGPSIRRSSRRRTISQASNATDDGEAEDKFTALRSPKPQAETSRSRSDRRRSMPARLVIQDGTTSSPKPKTRVDMLKLEELPSPRKSPKKVVKAEDADKNRRRSARLSVIDS